MNDQSELKDLLQRVTALEEDVTALENPPAGRR